MKRTPIKRCGKIGLANLQARKIISQISEEKELNLGNWLLAPAHRYPRAFYKGSVELLSDYKQWICCCSMCHEKLDRRTAESKELTEEIFLKIRGEEN